MLAVRRSLSVSRKNELPLTKFENEFVPRLNSLLTHSSLLSLKSISWIPIVINFKLMTDNQNTANLSYHHLLHSYRITCHSLACDSEKHLHQSCLCVPEQNKTRTPPSPLHTDRIVQTTNNRTTIQYHEESHKDPIARIISGRFQSS